MHWHIVSGIILVATLLGLSGCGTTRATSTQLARVAKDWSLVIRASQVIPVYPLTEDLQPGDVFLVQTPIEKQIKLYEAKGFLPLENLVARLRPLGYEAFYRGAFGVNGENRPPLHWQSKKDGWDEAPHAAFPSYSFSVQRGAGLSLALPVQGVPVALNLLGAGQAHGSITIKDAYTYGVDLLSLREQVEVWGEKHRQFLQNYAPTERGASYLRVVNRVYLTGKVNIMVSSAESYAGSVSGGAPKPVDLLRLDPNEPGKRYTEAMEALSKSVDTAIPGGTLKLASASGRTVSLIEKFPQPLVVGYIGFDLQIMEDGELGDPIPTQSLLSQTLTVRQEALRQLRQEEIILKEILDYVNDGTGKVDGNKLKVLVENTGLDRTPPNWVSRFAGKPLSVLKTDLKSVHGTSVPAIGRNLPRKKGNSP